MAKTLNIRQSMVFHDYYSRLKNIALSVYKWSGLPKTCDARFLEQCLFKYGIAGFVDDPDMGFLNMKVTPASTLNHYNNPTSYTAFSIDYHKEFDADDIVIVRNNYLNKSTDSSILLFAERLAILEMAISVNINAQKTPIFIRCDSKTEFSLRKIFEKYEGDAPVIFGHKSLQDKPLEVLNTGAPFVADKLREEKRAVWNEAFEFLGVNTNPTDSKKERVNVTEVNSNNEQVDMQALTGLMCRQDASEYLNEKWGWNCSVSMRVDDMKDAPHNQTQMEVV